MNYNYDKLNTLVTLAQNGNQEVFDEIYQLIHPIIRMQASSILQGEDDVQDIVQEAFIRIWDNIDKVGEPQYFIPWAKKVTTNLSLTHLKHRREFTTEDILYQVERNSDPIADVLDDYVALERSDDIQNIMNKLDPIIGTTLYLRYFKGLSIKEIALQLHIPEGTVKSRIHSGKRQLKKILKDDKRFNALYGGLLPIGMVLTEKSTSNVALASARSKVLTGVAATSLTCAVSVAAFYNPSTQEVQPAIAPSSSVTQVVDDVLPSLALIEYANSHLSISVSDTGSGVDYGRVYCALSDGQLVGPSFVDVDSGQVDFVTTGEDVLVYVYDIAGNSICQQLIVE